MSHLFVVTNAVLFLAMGILLVAALYAKRLPPGNRRLWLIFGALILCGALAGWEEAYIRQYLEQHPHAHYGHRAD